MIENSDKNLALEIAGAQTIDELERIVRKKTMWPVDFHEINADKCCERIERVRHGHLEASDTMKIPVVLGLRDALERLLPSDKVYKKYTQGSRAGKTAAHTNEINLPDSSDVGQKVHLKGRALESKAARDRLDELKREQDAREKDWAAQRKRKR